MYYGRESGAILVRWVGGEQPDLMRFLGVLEELGQVRDEVGDWVVQCHF